MKALKAFTLAAIVALLAGCAGMQTSGASPSGGATNYGEEQSEQDRIFRSYVN